VVTHNTGIREPDLQTFDHEIKKNIESMDRTFRTPHLLQKVFFYIAIN